MHCDSQVFINISEFFFPLDDCNVGFMIAGHHSFLREHILGNVRQSHIPSMYFFPSIKHGIQDVVTGQSG